MRKLPKCKLNDKHNNYSQIIHRIMLISVLHLTDEIFNNIVALCEEGYIYEKTPKVQVE